MSNKEKSTIEDGAEWIDEPETPIGTIIVPDAWMNIPMCLVKAFKDDIWHQEFLLQAILKLDNKFGKLDENLKETKRVLDKKIVDETKTLKNELTRIITATETKVNGMQG